MTKTRGLVLLKFGGKSRPFKFGWHFLKLYSEAFNLELAQLTGAFEHLTGNQLLVFIKIALEEGQRVSASPSPDEFSIQQIADWLDESGPEFFNSLTKQAQEAMAGLSKKVPAEAQVKN